MGSIEDPGNKEEKVKKSDPLMIKQFALIKKEAVHYYIE